MTSDWLAMVEQQPLIGSRFEFAQFYAAAVSWPLDGETPPDWLAISHFISLGGDDP